VTCSTSETVGSDYEQDTHGGGSAHRMVLELFTQKHGSEKNRVVFEPTVQDFLRSEATHLPTMRSLPGRKVCRL